ncbi:porin [Vibrio maerlii]|uniref:porin n=1 Tax=Vibrio maerlii TaxID=2231648 RepID=UPI000E3E87C8|nr:porin [Vibrio maerlii]
MKKTILAGIIATLSATSISAAELYKNEDTVVSFGGEVDAYLATTDIESLETENGVQKKVSSDSDLDTNVWAKIQLNAEQKLNEEFTAFASFEIESGSWYDGTDNDARFDDVYVGVKTEQWGVAVGEVGDLADSSDAIEKDDITNEGNYMGGIGGHNKESSGHGIVAKGNIADFTLVADIHTESDDGIDNLYGVSADYSVNGLSVGAMFQSGEVYKTDSDDDFIAGTDVDFQVYGASVSYEIKGFYAAVTYANFEGLDGFGFFDTKNDDFVDGSSLGLAASYTIDKARVYSTYAMAELDEYTKSGVSVGDGDVTNFVIGADYAVASNITTFVEYQTGEADSDVVGSTHGDLEGETVVAGVYYAF